MEQEGHDGYKQKQTPDAGSTFQEYNGGRFQFLRTGSVSAHEIASETAREKSIEEESLQIELGKLGSCKENILDSQEYLPSHDGNIEPNQMKEKRDDEVEGRSL